MRCFLYFEIVDQAPVTYLKQIISLVKVKHPEVFTYDFDNFSEEFIKNYALQLAQEHQKTVLYLAIGSESHLLKSLSWIEKLIRQNPALYLLSNQPNNYVRVLCQQYGTDYHIASDDAALENLLNQGCLG